MTHSDDIADDFEPAPPDKLAVYHRRQLSAMLDGEVSPDEARFMLRRLQHDSELAACWERWQVCGDILRGNGHALLPAGFSHRVAMAVAGDASSPGNTAAPAPRSSRLPRWAAGAALAASVAVVALFTARQLPEPAPRDGAGMAGTGTAPAAMPPAIVPPVPAQPSPDVPAAAATLVAAAAVAELPRQAAQRRSRAQSQRAASRVQQRLPADQAPARVAVTSAAPAPMAATAAMASTAPATGAAARGNPFAPQTDLPARPWPRAILPTAGNGGAFTASYQISTPGGGFHPFEPRLQAVGAHAEPGSSNPGPAGDAGGGETPAPGDPRSSP